TAMKPSPRVGLLSRSSLVPESSRGDPLAAMGGSEAQEKPGAATAPGLLKQGIRLLCRPWSRRFYLRLLVCQYLPESALAWLPRAWAWRCSARRGHSLH